MAETVRNNLLIIFIKNPEKGSVKTRLARSIGEDQALEIYHKLLLITKSAADQLGVDRQVWYSKFIADQDIWSIGDYERQLQQGSDLGERMKNALKHAFTDGYEKVVIIGSDCPAITSEIIERAFRALEDYDVVIGPSRDGGYYLLGTTGFHPDLFAGINWSTSSVYDQTVSKIKSRDLSMHLLPELNDIDTESDLRRSQILDVPL